MYACLGVTCHLHSWQNVRCLLRATAVTRGWNDYQIRASTQSYPWRRKFSRRSYWDSNSHPFDHESSALTNNLFRQVTPKYAFTLDPAKSEWADNAAVQAKCGNLSGNEFARNSSGNIRSQSSQLAEPLWTDPGLKSGIGVCELISTLKKKKKAQAGNELSNILPKSWHVGKKPSLSSPTKCVIPSSSLCTFPSWFELALSCREIKGGCDCLS